MLQSFPFFYHLFENTIQHQCLLQSANVCFQLQNIFWMIEERVLQWKISKNSYFYMRICSFTGLKLNKWQNKPRPNKKRFHRRYYRHPVADKSKSATNTTTKGEDEKKEVVDEVKKDEGGQGTKEEPSTVNTTSTATSPQK
ncbi:unnamed protein product [Meloidogyne enterolobii]|uniref:Uncharacterized protein n=1 Tax=Meloidogyne enterolobii TaxID=390850 RepID=A0ACB0YJI1_MELEN